MAQNLLVGGFEWVKNTSQFNGGTMKIVIKTTMQIVIHDIFFKLMINTRENYVKLAVIYLSFLPREMKSEKFEKLVSCINDKKEYLIEL